MPIRRMLGKRKRAPAVRARRRLRRRITRRRAVPRSPRSRTYLFKRYATALTYGTSNLSAGLSISNPSTNVWQASLAAASASSYYYASANAFCIQDIPNYSEFANLYDRYKLNMIVVKLLPFANDLATANSSGGSGGVGLLIHSALDYDDYTAPTANDAGVDTLRQYQSYRVINMAQRRVFKRVIRPKTLLAATNPTSTTLGNRVVKPGYFDMAVTNIPHMGYKCVFEWWSSSPATLLYNWKWEYTFYFSLRDVR